MAVAIGVSFSLCLSASLSLPLALSLSLSPSVCVSLYLSRRSSATGKVSKLCGGERRWDFFFEKNLKNLNLKFLVTRLQRGHPHEENSPKTGLEVLRKRSKIIFQKKFARKDSTIDEKKSSEKPWRGGPELTTLFRVGRLYSEAEFIG